MHVRRRRVRTPERGDDRWRRAVQPVLRELPHVRRDAGVPLRAPADAAPDHESGRVRRQRSVAPARSWRMDGHLRLLRQARTRHTRQS